MAKAKSRDVPADADLFPRPPVGVNVESGKESMPSSRHARPSGKARTTPFLEMQEYEADEERSFPGYCIGHYDKDCDECRICEIRDPSCMEMTRDFESLEKDEKEDGDGQEKG